MGLVLAAGLALGGGCSQNRPALNGAEAGEAAVTAPEAPAGGGAAVGRPRTGVAIINGEEKPAPEIAMGDRATIKRILNEGKYRNQVMNHLRHLSEQIGPRLTGSAAAELANNWTAEQFRSWGLSDVHLHRWGEIPVRFDRGPSTGKVLIGERPRRRGRDRGGEESGEGDAPAVEYRDARTLEFTTQAWMPGTKGPVRGPIVRLPQTEEEFEAVKDRLAGAWLLVPALPQNAPGGIGGRRGGASSARYEQRIENRKKVAEGADPMTLPPDERVIFFGINGLVSTSRDERVWTSAVPKWRELDPQAIPPDVEVQVRLSDYDYLNSRLTDGEDIQVEFDLNNSLTAGPWPVYNTVAEIRGTELPDECVIVSAHLDSWNGPGSMGTTDNGTGSAVTLEAARILMAAGAKPKRTIKFILWTGEEQGLLGSREWVKQSESMWPNISACFVDDGGTNYQGGLKCTDAMVPLLAAATAPVNFQFVDLKDGKPLNVNIQPQGDTFPRFGGSDHFSFVREGIPGFFWDEVGRAEYGFGWHTQNDRIDLAIPEYLMQSATCSAITAYNLACAPELLPRFAFDRDAPSEGRPPTVRRQTEGASN